jgi:hypothetical protein
MRGEKEWENPHAIAGCAALFSASASYSPSRVFSWVERLEGLFRRVSPQTMNPAKVRTCNVAYEIKSKAQLMKGKQWYHKFQEEIEDKKS